jgi:hypothetical protein
MYSDMFAKYVRRYEVGVKDFLNDFAKEQLIDLNERKILVAAVNVIRKGS